MRRNNKKKQGKLSWLSILVLVVVVIMTATYAGFLSTKHIIIPFFFQENDGDINGQNEILPPQNNSEVITESPDKTDQEQGNVNSIEALDTEIVMLYTLKFGTYSTKENADAAILQLQNKSIYGYPVESENQFKIYSLPFIDKDNATNFKDGYILMGEDCFVVPRQFTVASGYTTEFVKKYVDLIDEISTGTRSGQERLDQARNLLLELKMNYGTDDNVMGILTDKTMEEVSRITGSDNQILFQLQKTIIMNLSMVFA